MTKKLRIALFAGAFVLAMTPVLRLSAQHGHDRDHDRDHHVLLISIDGMHAVDYENCVASSTCPTLAALGKTGVNYTRTTTSRPSDSFPGLMAGGYTDAAGDPTPSAGIRARTVTSFVETDRVAPTILQILGLDPAALDAVRMESVTI